MNQPMHVVHVINNLPVGGAERFLVLLADAQRRRGLQVDVVGLTEPNPLAAALAARGIPFTCLGSTSLRDARIMAGLWRFLRRRKPDVVHTHLFYADTFGRLAARLAGVPVVVSTEHSTERTAVSGRRATAIRLAAPLAMRIAAVSSTVAEAAAARLHVSASRIEVIPNGIELAPWAAAQPVSRADLGIDPQAFLVGSVGRLDPAKGHDILIDAIAAMHDRRVQVVVVGDGPSRKALETQAGERGVAAAFHWLGWRSDVAAILASLDAFAQPSRFEGHSMALLEAMAAGRACVVSDLPELTSTLDDAGLQAAAGDPAAFAAQLGRLRDDGALRTRLGSAARAASAAYSIDVSAARYHDLYTRVAAERRRRLS
jgi:glycosyltransferase involved in cell wall biosynthesis